MSPLCFDIRANKNKIISWKTQLYIIGTYEMMLIKIISIWIERNLTNIYICISRYNYTKLYTHTRIKIFSNYILLFFLRRKTAMEIQKGIATVLCIYIDYIHILNECQHRQKLSISSQPLYVFFLLTHRIYHKKYTVSYLQTINNHCCVIFLIVVKQRFSAILYLRERLYSITLKLIKL